jgi:tRNA A-37 threonylcarbamoyl transferase component Bud32
LSDNPPTGARGAAALPGAAPARLGRYEVIRRMAVGGMAEIYLARASGPEGFEKVVVVKRIHPRLASSREVVTMFLDEARIAATLRHSNIVQVYDIGESDGEYFFAMELLHGEDAGALMQALGQRDRRLPLEHAVGIVANVCAGLHYAHEKVGRDGAPLGIVHRDVSPSNVFVTMDGEVKLLDFGVAKAAHRLSVTTGGLPKGKLPYMSPEQVAGAGLDRRSDIFSLAVLLWELATSRRLLRGKSDYEIMKAITDEDAPPPSVFQDDFPPDLERVVMKGLARDPAQRFQTAQELQLALEEFSREHKLAVSAITLGALMKDLFGVRRTAFLSTDPSARAVTEPPAAPAPGTDAGAVLGRATTDPEQAAVHAPDDVLGGAATEQELAPVRSPSALFAAGPTPPPAAPPPPQGPAAAPPPPDAAEPADADATAATQRLPKSEVPPMVRGGSAARAPTQEIPAARQQLLATASHAAVSSEPSATATGTFAAAPRKATHELPRVSEAHSVVTTTPSQTLTHPILRKRPINPTTVLVVVAAVLVVVLAVLLCIHLGLFGTATEPTPAARAVAAKAPAGKAAPRAPARAAVKAPPKAPAKAAPARTAPHGPSGPSAPHPTDPGRR